MRSVGTVLLGLMASIGLAPPAHSYTISFATGPVIELPGPNFAGTARTVDVNATFTLNAVTQQITISAQNLLERDGIDISSITQAVGAIEFTLSSTGSGVTSGSQAVSITGETGGSYVNISTTSSSIQPSPGNWGAVKLAEAPASGTNPTALPAIGPNTYEICVICDSRVSSGATGSPKGMLISGPSDPTTGAYSGAGSSLNAAHSPFLLASGDTYNSGPLNGAGSTPTWVLTLPANSLTANTTVSRVTFYFGSLAYEWQADGLTPEPGSWIMMISGLGAIGWFVRKRKA